MRLPPAIARGVLLAMGLTATTAAQTTTLQTPPPQTPAPTTTGRPSAPMPVQKQAIEYFVGQWTFNCIGPETPLGPGPRTGTLTFTLRAGGLDGITDAKTEEGAYRKTSTCSSTPKRRR